MFPSAKFRFGIVGLALGLTGAMTLHFSLRTHSTGFAPKTIAESQPSEVRPEPPQIVVAAAPVFPNVDVSATDEELLVLARNAVRRSREGAIDWARSQSDPVLTRRLLFAVVRAWGETDPNSAVDWALLQDDSERQIDVEAALAGAVKQPELALAIVRGVLKYDPDNRAACGPALVAALNNAGQFQTALEFLKDAPADSQADWTTATFRRWGQSQPQDAIQALGSIADETLRDDAFHAVVDGWSSSDPATLAKYAASVSDEKDQTYALAKALDNWSLQDPAGMAAWLNTAPTGVDLDHAVAQLISKTDGANRSPELAMKWVENISDPKLQSDSMTFVLGQWNRSDPAAAQQYLASASWMDEQKRQEILKRLQTGMADLAEGSVE